MTGLDHNRLHRGTEGSASSCRPGRGQVDVNRIMASSAWTAQLSPLSCPAFERAPLHQAGLLRCVALPFGPERLPLTTLCTCAHSYEQHCWWQPQNHAKCGATWSSALICRATVKGELCSEIEIAGLRTSATILSGYARRGQLSPCQPRMPRTTQPADATMPCAR